MSRETEESSSGYETDGRGLTVRIDGIGTLMP